MMGAARASGELFSCSKLPSTRRWHGAGGGRLYPLALAQSRLSEAKAALKAGPRSGALAEYLAEDAADERNRLETTRQVDVPHSFGTKDRPRKGRPRPRVARWEEELAFQKAFVLHDEEAARLFSGAAAQPAGPPPVLPPWPKPRRSTANQGAGKP